MMDYVREPEAIYANRSRRFARGRIAGAAEAIRPVATRIVHACGMPDLADDIVVSDNFARTARAALEAGAPVFCDAEMVRHGVISRLMPKANAVVCLLNDPQVREIAARDETTRSAAQVDLWAERMAGAVIAIGNAPTALFRLLELIDTGASKPAAIVGVPVGFVGAVESKAALAANSRGVEFLTVQGRRGGSALASAAVNALAGGLEGHG
jgi:precorrin-8X/cobalt-precorrin-8 methylmutase